MFINTKKSFRIKSDNGTVFEARAGWIGEIPKWVEEHWFFKGLCKDGSVTAIVSTKDKDIDPDDGDDELAALRARALELKVPRATQLGKEKLTAAIAEAEAKQKPDLLAEMDVDALRQFAESNKIDISGVAETASADELRDAIKAASKE
jgi:post-segregation antitoxin (ccd killing protein)